MRRYPLQFTAAFWLIGCRFGPFTVHSKYPHVQARSFTGLLYIVAKLWLGNQCLQSVLSEHFNLESVFHLTFSLVRKLKEKFSRVGDLHTRSLYRDFIELIMLLFSITNDVTHFPFGFFQRWLQESISTIASIQILGFSSARDSTSTWVDSCSLHAVSTSVKR